MTSIEKRQAWRKANFVCRCSGNNTATNCGVRSFCNSCYYIIPYMNLMQSTKCPGCNTFESWEHIGFLFWLVNLLTWLFKPFAKWYELLLNTWHPLPADENSSLETSGQESVIITKNYAEACTTPRFEQSELLRLRRQSIDDSLNTIRSQSSMDQNRIMFENLTVLKNNLMELKDNDNLTRSSHVSQNSSLQKSDRKMNPHDKGRQDDTMNLKPWSPLLPVEQNITIDRKYNWPIGSKNRSKRQIRTIQKKKAHKNSWLE